MSVVATAENSLHNLGLVEITGSATYQTLITYLHDKLMENRIDPKNVIGCTSDGYFQ